jgi:hypothetical protein
MKPYQASLLQVILALIVIVTSAGTPAIREFIFNNMQWLIVVVCITGIVFIQALKAIFAVDKRLKAKVKQQTHLLNSLAKSNVISARILKDLLMPGLFEQNPDQFIAHLHACGIAISDLKDFGIDQSIIARYELFYYIGKAKEQQDIIYGSKKTNGDIVNTPTLKEITGETDNTAYKLRPVSP